MPQVTRIDPVFGLAGERKLKVCAYCRVSSNSDDQLNSFAVQVKHYTKYIESHKEWEFVDIFADEGITGTSADKRAEFLRMMQLCKHGKIELILTKSISRFARNVPECLEYARNLKRQGVGIIFEKEAINTLRMSDELMLSTFSAIAQEESVAISQRLRHMNRERMKRGEYIASYSPFGYILDEEKRLVIYPSEADTVREIFSAYLNGRSITGIARDLTERGVPKRRGTDQWNYLTVYYILTNEKYVGDTLYQKTYTTDTLPFTGRKNRGELDQYYAEGTHEAIITKADFNAVQNLIKSRSEHFGKRQTNGPYPLTRKIRCSECGSYYVRKTTGIRTLWVCKKHLQDAESCSAQRYNEEAIYSAFVRMFNKLRYNSRAILRTTLSQLIYVIEYKKRTNDTVIRTNQAIAGRMEKRQALEQLRLKGYLAETVFQKQCRDIDRQIHQAKKDRELLYDNQLETICDQVKQLLKITESYNGEMMTFDKDVFSAIVEEAEINNMGIITFHLVAGFRFSERLMP